MDEDYKIKSELSALHPNASSETNSFVSLQIISCLATVDKNEVDAEFKTVTSCPETTQTAVVKDFVLLGTDCFRKPSIHHNKSMENK